MTTGLFLIRTDSHPINNSISNLTPNSNKEGIFKYLFQKIIGKINGKFRKSNKINR